MKVVVLGKGAKKWKGSRGLNTHESLLASEKHDHSLESC